jgi:arabinogalactan endo-1,4-beta-galactosidase
MLNELEQLGVRYRDKGKEEDIFVILKNYGIDTVRLRIWDNPYDKNGKPYGGGTNDLSATLAVAERVSQAGMKFILNIHYSDFWTDPGKQIKPKAWKEMSGKRLQREVYYYTRNMLEVFWQKQIYPWAVQIGNELSAGILWEDGKLPDYKSMFDLLSEGIRGVRDFQQMHPQMPPIQVIMHLDNGGNQELYQDWFDRCFAYGLDYNVIGLSYYPYWHGTLTELSQNLHNLALRYGKELLIAETSYGFTVDPIAGCQPVFSQEMADTAGFEPTPEGQKEFMVALMDHISNVELGKGMGFVYWCPEWIPTEGSTWATKSGREYIGDSAPGGNTWFNQAMFDPKGNVLPILSAIRDFKHSK